MNLSRLLDKELRRGPADERPSIDFLHADAQAKQLGRAGHMSRGDRGHMKVFIVDDNEDSANLLAEAMQFYGYQTAVSLDSADALNAMSSVKPDVGILDLGMPGMSGVELAQRLRKTRASGDLLLIALTGWGQQEAGEAATAAGFDFYFVKPADPGTLSALIDEEAFRQRVAGRK